MTMLVQRCFMEIHRCEPEADGSGREKIAQ
jgi:hypothetical protein